MQTFLINRSYSDRERENPKKKYFDLDLCQAVIGSNILLSKLNNSNFKNFRKKYFINQSIPNESSVIEYYVVIVQFVK